jgi:aryl-alcohol dehydrogenase-like predicted oxidoreductase
MNYHLLGDRTGLRVSPLALGTGRIGTAPGKPTDASAARALLHAFADAGGNFLDTSSAYQLGAAEEMVGAFLAEVRREDFVVASKYGRTAFASPAAAAAGSHRKAMRAEVEGSLRRLRTDHLDVYFVHYDDGVTPIEEIMRGLDDLARAGKIVHAGLSNFSAWRLASAATLADLRGWTPLSVLQLQYNLLCRDLDREHLPLARARGMGVMAYSPLASGMLGRARGLPQAAGAQPVADLPEVHAVVDEIAGELGASRASIALAWVLAKGLFPVIGPRTAQQLGANLAALEVRLTDEQMAQLDQVSARPLGYPYEILEKVRQHAGLAYPRSGNVL